MLDFLSNTYCKTFDSLAFQYSNYCNNVIVGDIMANSSLCKQVINFSKKFQKGFPPKTNY